MAWLAVLWAAVATNSLPSAQASSEIMKDVTLGFGEALKHCREEVSRAKNKYFILF